MNTTKGNKMDTRTKEQKSLFANAHKYPTAGRIYFFDIDTREEITLGSNDSGLPYQGRRECGIRDGKRYMDTVTAVEVVCYETKTVRSVTAEDFPGRRVAVKEWFPNGHWTHQDANDRNVAWSFLVDRRNGWQGNEADSGNIGESTLGKLARFEKSY